MAAEDGYEGFQKCRNGGRGVMFGFGMILFLAGFLFINLLPEKLALLGLELMLVAIYLKRKSK